MTDVKSKRNLSDFDSFNIINFKIRAAEVLNTTHNVNIFL